MDKLIQAFFNKIDSLYPISNEQKELFTSILKPLDMKKDSFFIRAGDVAHRIGFMIEGLLKYYYIAPDGSEYIRYFCVGDQFVSSYSSLLTGEPSDYFIQSLVDCRMLYCESKDWIKILTTYPDLGALVAKIQEYSLLLAEKRERSLILEDAKTRYLNFLKDFPGIEDKVRQYDIASYIGVTPVALSRIRNEK